MFKHHSFQGKYPPQNEQFTPEDGASRERKGERLPTIIFQMRKCHVPFTETIQHVNIKPTQEVTWPQQQSTHWTDGPPVPRGIMRSHLPKRPASKTFNAASTSRFTGGFWWWWWWWCGKHRWASGHALWKLFSEKNSMFSSQFVF